MRSRLRLALAFGVYAIAACGSSASDKAVIDAGRTGNLGEGVGNTGSVPDATLQEGTGDGANGSGDGGIGAVDAAGSASDGGVEGVGSGDAGPPVVCPAATLDAGDSSNTLILDGGGRTYNLHIPPGLDLSRPAPLVFAFHGGGQSAASFEGFAHVQPKADSSGFILVEPEGTIAIPGLSPGTLDVWNAGNCCELAAQINTNVDDVGFVRAMIDTISQQVCIDPKRIFATGFSNGGMLSHRLACQLSDKIAAIVAVSGGIGNVDLDMTPPETLFQCNPGRKVPVLHIHGTQDACYPYDGGWGPLSVVTFESVSVTIQNWLGLNGCSQSPPSTVLAKGATTCQLYPCPQTGEVELCTIDGGGHYWPGGGDWAGSEVFCGSNQGALTSDISANDVFWSWFMSHPMP
jgi:polyhydroxybutyrate depolymerase